MRLIQSWALCVSILFVHIMVRAFLMLTRSPSKTFDLSA